MSDDAGRIFRSRNLHLEFDPSSDKRGPDTSNLTPQLVQQREGHAIIRTRYFSAIASDQNYPFPLGADWFSVDVSGPAVFAIIDPPQAPTGQIGAYELFASPIDPPPVPPPGSSGYAPFPGQGTRILLPAAGRWWIGILTYTTHRVDCALYDCPNLEAARYLVDPPLASTQLQNALVPFPIAAATSTKVFNIGEWPRTRYVKLINVGTDDAWVNLLQDADQDVAMPLLIGETMLLSGADFPPSDVNVWSSAGTTLNVFFGT